MTRNTDDEGTKLRQHDTLLSIPYGVATAANVWVLNIWANTASNLAGEQHAGGTASPLTL